MFCALKSDKVGSYFFILITVYNHFIKALLFLSFLPQTMPVIYWSDRVGSIFGKWIFIILTNHAIF
jgi:hypothetical protein